MTAPVIDVQDVLSDLEAEVGLWALRRGEWIGVGRVRDPRCPRSEWMHEGGPPFRVIVSRDPFRLPNLGERVPYTGDEPTVDVDAWLVGG